MQSQRDFTLVGFTLLVWIAATVIVSFISACGSGRTTHLSSLTITPLVSTVSLGQNAQFTATGSFSDGTTKEMTHLAAWDTSDHQVVTIDSSGLATSVSTGDVAVTAAVNEIHVTARLSVGKPALVSLAVSPVSPTIPLGDNAQLVATGTFTDKSTQDLTSTVSWVSSEPNIADVNRTGVIVSKSLGTTLISATMGSVQASTQLTISAPPLVSIQVISDHSAVPLGNSAQLFASGIFKDGSTHDLTSVVTWTSSPAGVVSITSAGLATGKAVGTAVVTATQGSISGGVPLTVSAAALVSISVVSSKAAMPVGTTRQLAATGKFTDGTTGDISTAVSWTSSAPGILSLTTAGLATGKAAGTAEVTAAQGSISGNTSLSVSAAALVSISVASNNVAIPVGSTRQLAATGKFTDGTTGDITTAVSWTSSPDGVASVTSSGLATGKAVGTAVVTAAQGSISGSTSLSVSSAVLVSISVTSSNAAMPVGTTRQLIASGKFTDGTANDITNSVRWTSSAPGILSLTTAGLATGKSTGTAVVTAAQGSISGNTSLAVSAAALVSISVASNNAAMPVGTTRQLTASGKFTDGTANDITNAVRWTSSPAGILSLTTAGLVTGKSAGTAVVTATQGSISGDTTLTISPAAPVSVGVSSATSVMPVGTTQQLVATVTFTDGTTHDITNTVSWKSLSSTIVSITNRGVATAKTMGTATVSAASDTLSGTISLSVSAPALVSIAISPGNPQVALGSSHQLAAIGHFTDGNSYLLTQTLSWHLDKPEVASLSATGVATGRGVGTTSVEASSSGIVGTATLTVKPAEEVGYFTNSKVDGDTAVRITNPGLTGQSLCAMIYVFDQDQQMTECCGCLIARDALRTLSLNKDLISNPLTGVQPRAGTIALVTADYASNPTCDATSIKPSGTAVAWSTHLQHVQDNQPAAVTEDTFSPTILGDEQSAGLQTYCGYVRLLGGNQGTCGCGTGK